MKLANCILFGTLLGSTLWSAELPAAEWQREAGLSLGAYVSDNICLSESDHLTRGVGTFTPDLYISRLGTRSSVLLAAAVEYNTLGDSSLRCSSGQSAERANRESLVPSLRYAGDLEVVDGWLTLESEAFAGRNPADPFAAGGRDNLNGRDNANITYQYGVGAVVNHRFRDSYTLFTRYQHNEQFNKLNLLGDSSEDRAQFELGTDRDSNRIGLGIAGRYSKVMNAGSVRNPPFDNTLSSAEVWSSLQLSPTLQVNGLAGEEWNDFISAREELDGFRWDAGVRWRPNDRIEVNAGTGERFFGSTPRMSIRYEHRRSQLTASYARTLTFPRDLRVADDNLLFPGDPGFGEDIGQLPGDPLLVSGEPTFTGNSPIINNRLSLRYRFSGRRISMTLAGNRSRQTRTEDLGKATFSNAAVTFSRSLSPSLTANARLGWAETEGQGGNTGIFGRNSETWHAGLALMRSLGRNTVLSFGYQHTRRESDVAFNRYNENRLALTARHQFR